MLGSYAGVLTRVSFQFERGLASLPSNYTVMYAQLLGSFVLGVFVQFEVSGIRLPVTHTLIRMRKKTRTLFTSPQTRLAAANAPLLYRTLYTLVTAGFCGSITSFSTWMYEANKQLFTQVCPLIA